MSSFKEQSFISEFKSFLDEHVDGRLDAMMEKNNQIEELESTIETLESQIIDIESQISQHDDRLDTIESYGDVDERFDTLRERIADRFNDLEKGVQNSDSAQLLENITEIVRRSLNELSSRGQLHIHVAPLEEKTSP